MLNIWFPWCGFYSWCPFNDYFWFTNILILLHFLNFDFILFNSLVLTSHCVGINAIILKWFGFHHWLSIIHICFRYSSFLFHFHLIWIHMSFQYSWLWLGGILIIIHYILVLSLIQYKPIIFTEWWSNIGSSISYRCIPAWGTII